MTNKWERYYPPDRLHRWFAISSILLLAGLVWLLLHDFSREWKTYQIEFRQLEIEKTRQAYREESNRLAAMEEYRAIALEWHKEKQAMDNKDKIKEIQDRIEVMQNLYEKEDKIYQLTKAEYETTLYQCEMAQMANQEATHFTDRLSNLEKQLRGAKIKKEARGREAEDAQKKLDAIFSKLKSLEKKKLELEKQLGWAKTKLEKTDTDKMHTGNKVAENVRNWPFLEVFNPSYKIEQLVLDELFEESGSTYRHKVDRCVTCHQGILRSEFANSQQPYKSHPRLDIFLSVKAPHPVERFGCTVCHLGKGRGLDFVSAGHTPSTSEQQLAWKQKYGWVPLQNTEAMYPLAHTQAACLKCHHQEAEISTADKLNLGLYLLEKAQCTGCHNMGNYAVGSKKSSSLKHLKTKLNGGNEQASKDWAYAWLYNPQAVRPHTDMYSFFEVTNADPAYQQRVSQEIHAIVAYLFANSQELVLAEPPAGGDAKQGEELVKHIGCLGCHKLEPPSATANGKTIADIRQEYGPNLFGIGSKTSSRWLYHWLKNPKLNYPETKMPDMQLSDAEAVHMATYLGTLRYENGLSKTGVPPLDEQQMGLIALEFMLKTAHPDVVRKQFAQMDANAMRLYAGKSLISHYGCAGCHEIPGITNGQPIGPDLNNIGSKPLRQLDFGTVNMEQTRHGWLDKKLQNPHIFDRDQKKKWLERSKMPAFWFSQSQEQRQAIVTTLLGFVEDRPIPGKKKMVTSKGLAITQGQRIIRDNNCQGCHNLPTREMLLAETIQKMALADKVRLLSKDAPNLFGEGKRVQPDWLHRYLSRPVVLRPWAKLRMPAYALPNSQLNVLIEYFAGIENEEFPFISQQQLTTSGIERGKTLFDSFQCGNCHQVKKSPVGSVSQSAGMDLTMAKLRLKRPWLVEWFKTVPTHPPQVQGFPLFGNKCLLENLPEKDRDQEIEALCDYIFSLGK